MIIIAVGTDICPHVFVDHWLLLCLSLNTPSYFQLPVSEMSFLSWAPIPPLLFISVCRLSLGHSLFTALALYVRILLQIFHSVLTFYWSMVSMSAWRLYVHLLICTDVTQTSPTTTSTSTLSRSHLCQIIRTVHCLKNHCFNFSLTWQSLSRRSPSGTKPASVCWFISEA